MERAKVIDFPGIQRKQDKKKGQDRLNAGKSGRVFKRGGKLWVAFYYLGERAREPSGLVDTPANQALLRKKLDLIMAEIASGTFEFAKRFPHSKRAEFFADLEGKTFRKDPKDVLFGNYVEKWWVEMRTGMSENQARDYAAILQNHLLPFFGNLPLSEFRPVLLKKFLSFLQSKKAPRGNPLTAKSIRNILIPLRIIYSDACGEYDWSDMANPFAGIKLPKARRIRIHPFTFQEWNTLLEHLPAWYRPYFELAVQTGLRPSEQVALKWHAIDEQFIHIELSRVRGLEKVNLKTPESQRRLEIRPSMQQVLETQRELTAAFQSPYVFLNTEGRPTQQNALHAVWMTAMRKSGLFYRRMYETRHTFASWALAAGESPEWVARTLGHVDTSMVFRTYGRYIPNLTRQDGSAMESLVAGSLKKAT
jgi:integrase